MTLLRQSILLVSLSFSLMGCVTQGKYFESNTSWIKIGETKKQDVSLVLKKPFSVGSSSGMETWTYGYYKYKLFGQSQVKEIKFYWNNDSSLNRYTFNSSFPQDIDRANLKK
ncbi:MAG: hypothetical protein R3B45_11880 [Bdellovibrionota bacterium]